ncbi:holo-[acyl-carrier-protein] synthase [bacterium BMS3Bbin04]|nr:holo-[acyl-carrier-protein] synthase [bacterium BMS3Bbin04]
MTVPMKVGLDIVRVSRFESHVEVGDSLVARIFTPDEIAQIPFGPTRAQRLAGRWAAKEAVAKALGCGFGEELSFREVEILHDTKGAPLVRLTEAAAARHNNPTFSISITHDGEYAAAIAAAL